MGRVTVHVADSMLSALDAEAHNRSISRSQAVALAVEAFISGVNQATLEAHNLETELSGTKEEVMRLRQELSNFTDQIAEKDSALKSKGSEVMLLQEEIKRVYADLGKAQKIQTDAEQYKDDFDQLKTRYDQSLTEATQRWEELKGYKSENTKLKKQLDESQATTQRLQGELLTKQTEVDRIAALREELATTKNDRDRLQEALRSRDEDVAWLRGHVAQLTQQLALPPSEEEAKKKGWWQFWRRD